MFEIICDQCGREILDDCLADALLHDVKDGGGNYEEVEYEK